MNTMAFLGTFFTFYSRKINENVLKFLLSNQLYFDDSLFSDFLLLGHHHRSLRKFDQFTMKPN